MLCLAALSCVSCCWFASVVPSGSLACFTLTNHLFCHCSRWAEASTMLQQEQQLWVWPFCMGLVDLQHWCWELHFCLDFCACFISFLSPLPMPFSRSIADLSWQKTNDFMLLNDSGFLLTVRRHICGCFRICHPVAWIATMWPEKQFNQLEWQAGWHLNRLVFNIVLPMTSNFSHTLCAESFDSEMPPCSSRFALIYQWSTLIMPQGGLYINKQ